MNYPADLKYSKDHEWIRIVDNGKACIVGITDYAQSQLGDIVYVELPKVEDTFEKSEPFGTVEAVKTVSEVYMPVSGKILECNGSLEDDPEQVNEDPYGEGWLVKILMSNPKDVDELMHAAQYEDYIKEDQS